MSSVAKPQSTSDMLCPFFRAAMRKTCHRCEFWEALPVGRQVMVEGSLKMEASEQWGCTLKHQTFVLRDIVQGLGGLQKAEESFRNTAWNESQKNISDIIETVKAQTRSNADALRAVGSGLSEVVRLAESRAALPSPTTKLVNGDDRS